MGFLLPADAFGRRLTWNDFQRKNSPAPAPGATASAAFTSVFRRVSPSRFNFARVEFLKPPNVKMREDPSVMIVFDTSSWVENWVFSQQQTFQDSLLSHEQGHYDIAALNARDFWKELESISSTAFATAKDGVTRIKSMEARLSQVQPIHDKYDLDTNHGLNAAPQAAWIAALQNARGPTSSLLGALGSAALFP